jgi:hypothetical protein
MSKDSKPTKKSAVSKRRPMKKGVVSNDSKPAEESAVSNDSKPTKKATVSRDSKSIKKGTVYDDSKRAEESAVSNDMKPTETGAAVETPVFDFTKLMSQFQLPGVDFTALVDLERRTSRLSSKRIGSLSKAGSASFVGKQKCSRKL